MERSKAKILKKIWSIVSWVAVGLVVLIAVFLIGVRILGYKPYTILSGSMAPTYKPGDIVYVKETDPEDIDVGDVITVRISDNTNVTHRVVRVDRENECFYTMGDYTGAEEDPARSYESVAGVVKFSIPKIGYVSNFLSTTRGKLITIIVLILCVVVFVLVPELFKKEQE